MSRRRRLFFVLLLVAALGALVRLPLWTAALLGRALSAYTHRAVRVETVRYRLWPLGLEIRGLQVAGKAPEAPPLLTVRWLRVVPSVQPLFGRRLSLWRLDVDGARLLVHTYAGGGDDLPTLGGGGAGGAELEVRRVVVTDSELVLDDTRIPLRLDLPRFRARLATREGRLRGRLALGPGPAQFGEGPPLDVGLEAEVSLGQGALQIEGARLAARGTELAVSGLLGVRGRLRGRFTLSGPLDLAVADQHVLHTGFGIQGTGHVQGAAVLDRGRLSFQGRLEGTNGIFDGQALPHFAGAVSWDPGSGLTLRDFALEVWGGRGALDVRVERGAGQARVSGQMEGVDAESLVRYVFDLRPAGLGSQATGRLDVSWPRGHGERISGEVGLALSPLPDGRTPLEGQIDWQAHDGQQQLARLDLRTPDTQFRAHGEIAPGLRAALEVEGESTDLAHADDLGVRVRRALHLQAEHLGFGGRGRFQGHWGGTLRDPVVEGRFEGESVHYLDVDWGHAQWTGTLTSDEVRSQSLVLRRGEGELRLEGRNGTGEAGSGHDGVDLRVAFHAWSAADLLHVAESDLALAGPLTGEAQLQGPRAAPQGTVRATAGEGRLAGIAFRDLAARLALHGTLTEVQEATATVGGGRVRLQGTVTADDVYDGQAHLEEVDLGALTPELPGGVRWGGRLSAEGTLSGRLDAPRGEAHLTAPRVFLGDEGVGALDLTVRGEGDGQLAVAGRLRSGRVDLGVQGRVGAAAPHPAQLAISAQETSLDPFVRVFTPALPEAVGLVTSGELTVEGPLSRPEELSAQVRLPVLRVQLPDYPVQSTQPLAATYRDGVLRLDDVHLAGEGTDLLLAGQLGVLAQRPVSLRVRGDADLRALGAITRRLRGQGAAHLAVTVAGTAGAPRVDGRLEIAGGGLRVRGFPHGLEGVHGTVTFNERSAQFDGLTGTLGGGAVEAGGQAAWDGARLKSFEVRLAGRDLSLRYPEGLRSLVDAELRLFGDGERQWATGSVDVRQAVWTRRYDVASELLSSRPAWEQRASLREGVHLDIHVLAPDTLRVDNNLAALTARADLQLQGTSENPVVLGRAEIERGRVFFQGNTYVIRRGTIDFANPQRIDPLFDIEAETRLRSYRVTLKVNGTLERVYPTLTADPPLNAVQIVTLLAGGDETTVQNLTHAAGGSSPGLSASGANLAATGAATLAAGRISEEVGLERGAERLLGLNRFSIDPSLVKGGVQNPTARLTLGKRVTPDLSVLYSLDLKGSEDRLLSVEYTLSDQFSLLFTRSDPGGDYGFDLRRRQSH